MSHIYKENDTIFVHDDIQIFDNLYTSLTSEKKTGPVGWVKVLLDNKKTFEGPNLVVGRGREFVAQNLFGIYKKVNGTNLTNYTNHVISHFAVGSGGTSVLEEQVTLKGPLLKDTGLYKPIKLGDTAYLNEPSLKEDTSVTPIIYSYKDSVKPIIASDGSIGIESVEYENNGSFFTRVKCICNIPIGEPTALAPGGFVKIDEAGLYFVNTGLADTDPNKVQMFAHICFPPNYKVKESIMTIVWYILC